MILALTFDGHFIWMNGNRTHGMDWNDITRGDNLYEGCW